MRGSKVRLELIYVWDMEESFTEFKDKILNKILKLKITDLVYYKENEKKIKIKPYYNYRLEINKENWAINFEIGSLGIMLDIVDDFALLPAVHPMDDFLSQRINWWKHRELIAVKFDGRLKVTPKRYYKMTKELGGGWYIHWYYPLYPWEELDIEDRIVYDKLTGERKELDRETTEKILQLHKKRFNEI